MIRATSNLRESSLIHARENEFLPLNIGAPTECKWDLFLKVRGNKVLCACVGDYFTKWVSAIPIPNQEAQTAATVTTEHVFSIFGIPDQLHSDLGRNYECTLSCYVNCLQY